MAVQQREAYGEFELERKPDVEHGLELVRMLFAKIDELEERVERLELRERVVKVGLERRFATQDE